MGAEAGGAFFAGFFAFFLTVALSYESSSSRSARSSSDASLFCPFDSSYDSSSATIARLAAPPLLGYLLTTSSSLSSSTTLFLLRFSSIKTISYYQSCLPLTTTRDAALGLFSDVPIPANPVFKSEIPPLRTCDPSSCFTGVISENVRDFF